MIGISEYILGFAKKLKNIVLSGMLFQTPTPEPDDWFEEWVDKQDVGTYIVIFLLGLLLFKPLEALLKWLWEKLKIFVEALGFRFQERYYRYLNNEHRWLKLIGFRKAGLDRPKLGDVYISLTMAAISPQAQQFHWTQIFADPKRRHMVILGLPGSGKTTLLDYLTLIFTGEVPHNIRKKLDDPIPVYIRLRDFDPSKQRSLLGLIQSPDGINKVPGGYFLRLLERGKCILLIDGLDEVLDEDKHQRAVAEITSLISEYPNAWIVVTCRIAGWHDQLPGIPTYEIQELEREDIRKFVGAWYREVLRSQMVNALGPNPDTQTKQEEIQRALQDANQRAEDLWTALQANQGLLRIARTPLILSLITLVHYTRRTQLPKGRAMLYQRCLDILLEEWDLEDKRLRIENSPSLNDKLLALKMIAFTYLRDDYLELDLAGLEVLVAPLIESLSVEISARALIENIYQRSGVLVEQKIGYYGFAHRALLDYLAASQIAEQGFDEMLLANTGEERWREVILIAVGMVGKERSEKLVTALLTQSQTDLNSLALAGWALAEDVQVGRDLRAEVNQRLIDCLQQIEHPSDFSRVGTALLAADLDAFQDWLRQGLEGRDVARQQRILGLFFELGADEGRSFVPLLLELAQDRTVSPIVSALAITALGDLVTEPDRQLWAVLNQARQSQETLHKQAANWAWCQLGRYEELGLVRVPAGEFLMGSDPAVDRYTNSGELPQHVLYLQNYYIGKAPVTMAEWRLFVESGNKSGDVTSMKGRADHPVVNVKWYDALAYAQWLGMGLPSEAQWEKAARGEDGRIHPWGDQWQAGLANNREYWSGGQGLWSRLRIRLAGSGTTPVGHFSPLGDSPYGCVDMVGNVWEWTRTLWGEDFKYPEFRYPYDASDGRELLGAPGSVRRVLRGGSFYNRQGVARCAARRRLHPDLRHSSPLGLGFRVVLAPFSFPLNSEASDL